MEPHCARSRGSPAHDRLRGDLDLHAAQSKFAADGLLQVNTHLDPVAWKSGGGLLDPSLLDAQLAAELEAPQMGSADNSEPYGLLTHHLVQDDATWAFTAKLVEMLLESGVARWTPPLHEIARS